MTPLRDAARAVELVEGAGYTPEMASRVTGLSKHTVENIINGNEGWEERKNRPVFAQYWRDEKLRLQHAMTQLTKEALVRAHDSLDKASFYQAVTGAAILIDKTRLLAGEPTEITANLNIQAVGSLDRLANMLGHSLVDVQAGEQATPAVDITP